MQWAGGQKAAKKAEGQMMLGQLPLTCVSQCSGQHSMHLVLQLSQS